MRTWIKRKDAKLPEQILNKKNVVKLIKACCNPRDKAIVSVLYESGTRVGEFLGMKVRTFSSISMVQ